MWVFTKDGFFSASNDLHDDQRYIVRARFPGDIENLNGFSTKLLPRGSDYPFRASLTKRDFAGYVDESLRGIDYYSFKDNVADKNPIRLRAYMDIWNTLRLAGISD